MFLVAFINEIVFLKLVFRNFQNFERYGQKTTRKLSKRGKFTANKCLANFNYIF